MLLSRVGTSGSSLEEVQQAQQKRSSSITIATLTSDYISSPFIFVPVKNWMKSSQLQEQLLEQRVWPTLLQWRCHICHGVDMTQNLGNDQYPCDLKVLFQWMVGWWFLYYQNENDDYLVDMPNIWQKLTNLNLNQLSWPLIDIHELIENV